MKKRLQFWFNTYFGFSSKETVGFLLVVPILGLLSFVPFLISWVKNQKEALSYVEYTLAVDSLEKAGVILVSSPLLAFNPQDTVKKDFKSNQLERINRIPFSEADSITLQIVPGIGPATAGRIIKYRENLGGFVAKSQLMEVYGMKAETAEAVWEFFEFDPGIRKKLQINQTEAADLARHPYISYSEAKVIVAYRNQHGAFRNSEDLLKIRIFKKEWVDKISPYLNFD
ncbi:ComEA family DNA-binding protein [Algoriphagus taiwanensis]|uniref:Helix-hairpin-helix DNA-binding motif class 1 domain-containing protein n=1 Tax=Algoriphagus taiwanensis TaxID=1445656 RepID=A0ABQ6PZQ5_9BACT|nr:hypothetical protein Ataiwa_05440 [Algoriphagus taiwanensis]